MSLSPKNRPAFSLVVPVYNECESLHLLYERVCNTMEGMGQSWELIFVDDGSSDGSTEILRQIQAGNTNVVLGVQRRNFGKSAALMSGFALARGDVIFTLDSDLQDEPAELPRLLAALQEGYDIVTGWKQTRRDPLSKRIPSRIANTVTGWLTGLHLHDMNSGLKAYRADCARHLHIYGDLHRYIPIIAHLDGFRVTEIPVTHHPRRFGRSKYGASRLIRGGLDLITVLFLTRYGRRPLHLFGVVGGLLLSSGLLINLMLTIEWFRGIRPIGDRPLLLLGVLLMLVGVQLLTMGLIAELVVAFMQRRDDPLATTREVLRPQGTEQQHV